jgi:hypothetical protein
MQGKVQSIHVPKKLWKLDAFKAWLEKQGYKPLTIGERTDGSRWLAVMEDPDHFQRLREKESGRGLVFVVGYGEASSGAAPSDGSWLDRDIVGSLKSFFGVA